MNRLSVYISPSATRKEGKRRNPYFDRLKQGLSEYFNIYELDNKPRIMQSWALFIHSFKADIFLLSFVENVAFHRLPFLQTVLVRLSLGIINLRKKSIIFIFHNPIPHQGHNWLSRYLMNLLLDRAWTVVAHSEETAQIARSRKGANRVLYFPHPTENRVEVKPNKEKTDVLLWGTIHPYKGVAEFLSIKGLKQSGLSVKIIGACPDPELAKRIHSLCTENICFEQRWPSMEEIGSLIAGSRFVLMPYLPGSISGSGALMDTLKYGGSAVGPDIGAFHDLADLGLCKVYRNPEELMEVLLSDWKVDNDKLSDYLSAHSWSSFIQALLPFCALQKNEP